MINKFLQQPSSSESNELERKTVKFMFRSENDPVTERMIWMVSYLIDCNWENEIPEFDYKDKVISGLSIGYEFNSSDSSFSFTLFREGLKIKDLDISEVDEKGYFIIIILPEMIE